MKFPRRISLRTLLILMTTIGGGLGYYMHLHRIKVRERKAIYALQAGFHGIGMQRNDSPWLIPVKWFAPDDFFEHSKSLQVWNFKPEELACTEDLPYVENVHILEDEIFNSGKLTEEHFQTFRNHRLIRDLYVNAPFNDELLRYFAASRLKRLVLLRTEVTGSGLEHVRPDRLTVMTLHDAPLGDDGLRHIGRFHQLRHLWIESTGSDDDALRPLAELTTLETLCLNQLPITDKCLDHLPSRNLTRLYLREAPLTDEAINSLARFQSLTDIYLVLTEVTPAGIDRLKQVLPNCRYRLEPDQGVQRTARGFKYDSVFFAHPGVVGSFGGWSYTE